MITLIGDPLTKQESAIQAALDRKREARLREGLMTADDLLQYFSFTADQLRDSLKTKGFPQPLPGTRPKLFRYDEMRHWLLDNVPSYRFNQWARRFITGEFDVRRAPGKAKWKRAA